MSVPHANGLHTLVRDRKPHELLVGALRGRKPMDGHHIEDFYQTCLDSVIPSLDGRAEHRLVLAPPRR